MVPIGRSLIRFKIGNDGAGEVTKFDFKKELTRPTMTQLPACPKQIFLSFAVTRVGKQSILLTGGLS